MDWTPTTDGYVWLPAKSRAIRVLVLNRDTGSIVGVRADGGRETYTRGEYERYAGIDPPPAYMNDDQYAELMTNYD